MNTDELSTIFEADIQRMVQQADQYDAQAKQMAEKAQQLRGAAEYARSALQLIQQRKAATDEDNAGS